VVEHPVENDAQATACRLGDQVVEILLVAEPGIDREVIHGVVAVGLGREDRSEQQARAAESGRVIEPSGQLPEPVPDRLLGRQRRLLRTRETERVHMPPDNVIGP
jgi:hypothetical protein